MTVGQSAKWTVLGAAAMLAFGPAARAQDLGALARQEKERRALEARLDKSGGTVFTDDDLKRYELGRPSAQRGATAVAAASMAGASAGSSASAGDAAANKAYWDVKLDAARVAVDRAEQSDRDARAAVSAAREQPEDATYDDALALAAERQARAAEAEVAQRELEQARRAYDEVERQAREAAAL